MEVFDASRENGMFTGLIRILDDSIVLLEV